MKRYFLLLCIFISSIANAQDTINRKFILFLNGGVSIPANEYQVAQGVTNITPPTQVYGYAARGLHLDATGIYIIPSTNLGIAIRAGTDINKASSEWPYPGSTRDIVNQYLAGLYLSTKPKQAKFNVYFVGLIGLVTANINHSFNWFDNSSVSMGVGVQPTFVYGNETPGFGTGVGFYGGLGLSYKVYKRLCLNCLIGYLASTIYFQNGSVTSTTTSYPGTTTTEVSQQTMQMKLGILQANFGIGYQF